MIQEEVKGNDAQRRVYKKAPTSETPAEKKPGIDENGNYRIVTRGDDGQFWLEVRRPVEGKYTQLVERSPLPVEGFELARPKKQGQNEAVDGFNKTLGLQVKEKQPANDQNAAVPPTAASPAGKPLDLIALATSYADALSSVEAAPDAAARQQASRKADLLLRIARVELKAVSAECERIEQLRKKGYAPAGLVTEVEARREILREILETGTAHPEIKPPPTQRELPQ
jgi:hypothetical protein